MKAFPASPAASLPNASHFQDLRLSIGHRLQLHVAGRSEPVAARLLGYQKGETLLVKLAISQLTGADALHEGDEVEVRGFSGRIAFTFVTRVEQIRFSPYAYCHLRYPSLVQGMRIRHAERVRVQLPVRVKGAGGSMSGEINAAISNLSVDGALLLASQPLGQVGDRLALSFRFWIMPNEYEVNFNVNATVQAAGPLEDGQFSYGVKFEGMRSTEAILLQNLVYQRMQEDPDNVI